MKGKKYDNGKLRYDLIPTLPLKDLAEVYTVGAGKYEDDNWRNGIKFTRIIAAIERHVQKFKNGQNYDDEFNTPHLAHAAWGCFTLLEMMRTKTEFDNRPKVMQRIGYDIDGVVCDFIQEAIDMCKANGVSCPENHYDWVDYSPLNWDDEIKPLLFTDDSVYRNAPAYEHEFISQPICYITIRHKTNKEATNLWFDKHQAVPKAPIEFVNTIEEKVQMYNKYKLDLFIEDTVENFDVMTARGCNVLMIRRPWNIGKRHETFYISDLSEVYQGFEEIL